MAGSLSNYAETAVLNHFFKGTAYTQPTNLYVALCTADPGETGTGSTITEPSGNGYARTQCNTWTVSGGSVSNTGAVTFPTATGAWGTVSHFVIVDASTAGNVIVQGTLNTSKSITAGDTPSFAAGTLAGTLD